MYVHSNVLKIKGDSSTSGFSSADDFEMASDNKREWYDVLINAAQVADEKEINNHLRITNLSVNDYTQNDSYLSLSRAETLKNLAHDHSYEKPYNFTGDYLSRVLHDEYLSDEEVCEELDKLSKIDGNQSNPNYVQEVKFQFLVGTLPFPHINPLKSSFDVACVEELNPDGSPVDKMHVPHSCGVHMCYEDWCSMCISNRELCSYSVDGYASKDVHLECLDNKVNNRTIKSSKRKNCESLDFSEDGENVDKTFIMKLIEELGKKKRNKGPLMCEICGRRFTTVGTLKNHYRSHGNIKLYACSLCDSTFTRRYGLSYHMQIHNNKFRYSCSKCSRQFRHTTHFKAHCRDHSFGRPIQCTLCPSSFKNRNTLNRHLKTKHTSPT